jgi:hypothetical protein
MTFFTDKTSLSIENALDDFDRAIKKLRLLLQDLQAVLRLHKINFLSRIILFPLKVYASNKIQSTAAIIKSLEKPHQLLHQIWVLIREENELKSCFKKMVNEDAQDLINHLNERDFDKTYISFIRNSPNQFILLKSEIANIHYHTIKGNH